METTTAPDVSDVAIMGESHLGFREILKERLADVDLGKNTMSLEESMEDINRILRTEYGF
jgi:hypothetical protein